MNVSTCPGCIPGTNRHRDWTREPILWDDHGQPLCHTQAEEDALLDELTKDATLNNNQPTDHTQNPLTFPNEMPF